MNRTMRVLVADDDEEALDYVDRRGRFADRRRPHLLVLDLKMPKVDGFEVLHRLKGAPDLCSIPVVVLSASDRPEDVEAAYRNGTNSYVTKQSSANGGRDGVGGLSEYWIAIAELPEPPR